MNDERKWDLVRRRDRAGDGQFVYAVTSTGIFCRPSCPSRRPGQERVRFFDTPAAAERAGYRACKRCRPASDGPLATIDDAITRASRYLTRHADQTVPLSALAKVARVSASHLQRQFKRALGVSPREFQAACRATQFRDQLRAGSDVTTALYAAGYGSPSRVYEGAPTGPGMAPATYRRGGAGLTINYTTVQTPLGWLLVATTSKGVCAVQLGDTRSALIAALAREFPQAALVAQPGVNKQWVTSIVARLQGAVTGIDVPLDVRGTAFQWRVWQALRDIPSGETRSYSAVARAIGQPSAARAVARACATNPVCAVVPCHRVVAKDGALGGYRWGAKRKAQLLAVESARAGRQPRTASKAK